MSHRLFSRRHILALLSAALAARAAPAVATETNISGFVELRERFTLPPDSTLEVRLVEMLQDAGTPVEPIAIARIPADQRRLIPYELTYDRSRLDPARRYGLDARILWGDEILLETRMPRRFAGDTLDVTHLMVEAPRWALPPTGRWLAEEIGGGGVLDRQNSVLVFEGGGGISGNTGCNWFTGNVAFDGAKIRLGVVTMSARSCDDLIGSQESNFLTALGAAEAFQVRRDERTLVLFGLRGKTVMRLSKI